MSINGERIGRRLARRHGFAFKYDPCNFVVRSDPVGVALNVHGGRGVMQWVLWIDYEPPTIDFHGRQTLAEIGSSFGASTVLRWKYWHVFFDKSLTGTCITNSPIIWINRGVGVDKMEM